MLQITKINIVISQLSNKQLLKKSLIPLVYLEFDIINLTSH